MPSHFNCVIVDDEPDAAELLLSSLELLYKNISIVAVCNSWKDALAILQAQDCDILFMDISMPEKNGIELLRLLPGLDCEIIFVTAHEDYALQVFSFPTSGYLLKPVDDVLLAAAVNKAITRIKSKRPPAASNATPDRIGIPNKNGIDYVHIKDIIYLESTNKCTKIVTRICDYTSSHNLGKFLYLTEANNFFQVHRSYIVNLNNILRYESEGSVVMDNKHKIPISRNIKNDLFKRIAT